MIPPLSPPIPPPPHWKLIGSQFPKIHFYSILTTTDPPSIPPENHAMPQKSSTAPFPQGYKWWLVPN